MAEKWQVVFWESRRGKRPVEQWLDDLPRNDLKRMAKLIRMVQERGPWLGMPFCRNLGDGLYELRDQGAGPGYRIYYGLFDRIVVLLVAAGDKSSQERDIFQARKRLQDKE